MYWPLCWLRAEFALSCGAEPKEELKGSARHLLPGRPIRPRHYSLRQGSNALERSRKLVVSITTVQDVAHPLLAQSCLDPLVRSITCPCCSGCVEFIHSVPRTQASCKQRALVHVHIVYALCDCLPGAPSRQQVEPRALVSLNNSNIVASD